MRHFEEKYKLFGTDSLSKNIEISDLGQGDLKYLQAGHLQILPERDRAGRSVLCVMPIFNYVKFEQKHLVSDIFLLSIWVRVVNILKMEWIHSNRIFSWIYRTGAGNMVYAHGFFEGGGNAETRVRHSHY